MKHRKPSLNPNNKPATKGDLRLLKRNLEALETHQKDDLHAAVKEFKETVISFKDAILHEIKAMREEVAIVTGYKDQIEDHETRIETVEKKLQIPAVI